MRKRYRVLLLAAVVAAFVVPVGFALSLESSSPSARLRHLPVSSVTGIGSVDAATTASAAVTSSVLVSTAAVDAPAAVVGRSVPDAAKLLLVGTMLFGLAAAVRKAI
jgi:hypothetical protein